MKNNPEDLKKAYDRLKNEELEPVVNMYDSWADSPDDVLRGMVEGFCTLEESERVVHIIER